MLNIDDRLLDLVTPDELYLLCRIASHLGSDGSCFPGNKRLQQLTGFKERHLLRQKKSLLDKKLLGATFRFRDDDGTQASSRYTVETELLGVYVSAKKLSHQTPPTVSEDTLEGVTPDTLPLSVQTPREVLVSSLSINQEVNNKELVESYNSTVVVHDQVDGIGLQVHDVIEDNAALLPQLDVDEEKKKGSGAKRKERAAKNSDPTPINAMWDILLEQSAKIGNDEPQFMPRYGRDFKLLYAILKQRAEKRKEPITDQVEPFRRYVTKIVDYIIKGRKVPQHQFTANNLARNFNPGYLHTSFNQICATIQSGVTVTNQPNKPTAYNESEVYRNFDSSQAAF